MRLFNVEDTTRRDEMKVVEDLVNLLDNPAPRLPSPRSVTNVVLPTVMAISSKFYDNSLTIFWQ